MINKYLESASTFSGDIDNLIWLVLVIVGFWFLLAEGVLFYLVLRYKQQEGVKAKYVSGELASEKRWVTIPHYITLIFDIMIVVAALKVWHTVKLEMPKPDRTIRVIAQQWAWTFQDPGPDGELDTEDDIRTVDELHVEKDKTYAFELTSRDVLHSFSVPVFRLKQDAVPGRVIKGWFKPTLTGGFDIQCTEICGIGHGLMPARILVENAADHAAWLRSQAPATASTTPTVAPPTNGGTP